MVERSARSLDGLDALRGIAAVAVMLYHAQPFLGGTQRLPGAYLAVDLFFLLSGFVICHAYEVRLQGGLSVGGFLRRRLVRLYPLYLAGTLLGAAYILARSGLLHDGRVAIPELLRALGLAVLFVPQPQEGAGLAGLYPLDPASWSLALELAVNLAYACALPWLVGRRLLAMLAVAAVALVAAALVFHSLDAGMTRRTLPGGAARVVFSFAAGVLLYRIRVTAWRLLPSCPHPVLWLVLLAVFVISPPAARRAPFDLACAMLLFPLVIVVASRQEPRRLLGVSRALGSLSYPLYILHTPLLLIAAGMWKALERADPQDAAPWSGALFACTILLASAAALRIDEPLRAWLGRRPRAARAGAVRGVGWPA